MYIFQLMACARIAFRRVHYTCEVSAMIDLKAFIHKSNIVGELGRLHQPLGLDPIHRDCNVNTFKPQKSLKRGNIT